MDTVAKGAVKPEAAALGLEAAEFEATVLEVHPENGYDAEGQPIPSEHDMVLVGFPLDQFKRFQCNSVDKLTECVTTFVQRKLGVSEFQFAALPERVEVGAKFQMKQA